MILVISAHIYANSAPYFTPAVVCVTEGDWSTVFTDSARSMGEMIRHKSPCTSIPRKRVHWAFELLANPSCGSQECTPRHVINLDSFQQSATVPLRSIARSPARPDVRETRPDCLSALRVWTRRGAWVPADRFFIQMWQNSFIKVIHSFGNVC